MADNKLFLGDGGCVPQSAQDEYNTAELLARVAYDQVMAGAPARTGLRAPISTEYRSFLDRADAAYEATSALECCHQENSSTLRGLLAGCAN